MDITRDPAQLPPEARELHAKLREHADAHRAIAREHGDDMATICLLTGNTPEQIKQLGGIGSLN